MVSVVGLVPASSCPSRIENSGIASTMSSPVAVMAQGQGRLLTLRPQRAKALCS